MRNLIDILDFSTDEIDGLCRVASEIIANPEAYADACRGKILGTLFFEPSTRTRLSFTSSMMSLGGNVLGFSNSGSSSVTKGETLSDTIRMVSAYSDIITMRHPKEGAPIVASRVSSVPIINAGDGGHFHPSQTLTDLLTIRHEKGKFEGLTVGFCGDLKFGRTVHSLIEAMSRYPDVKFVLISPDELKLPDFVRKNYIEDKGLEYQQVSSLDDVMPQLDILYMTRVQGERFFNEEEYLRLRDTYILTPEKMKNAKDDMIVMHPLPRVNEIDTRLDEDPRACYFRQAHYGKFIRMALILKLLEIQV
jgi:aspartate carbamoyltransferase catalytic subunit